MPAPKLTSILSAALLILPLTAQAKQPSGLPAFLRSINQAAPIQSGPITISRATQQNGHILIHAAINSQQLPLPPQTQREPTIQALQTLTEAAWCQHPRFPTLNQNHSLTARYQISGETQPINITLPAGRCTQIQSSQTPEQQADAVQIADLILHLPGINQRLPLTDGKLTLQRIDFHHPSQTLHKHLTLNEPALACAPEAQIRERIQNEARALECEDPILAQNNRHYPTTHHFTLPNRTETFETTIPKNSCTPAAKPN
ncbi:hypothetical protein H9Q10_07180 [Eikenella sp. S3360]|uniref:Uncharacterized protein n=1 Tax=Eikenella glucosivorans TaxID=2766967 RepID=A0ABS0NAY2_9NEIS|nr:hypothetical protein [Eikenella glucosivorans]MBH5329447.1 hypothetical protein [Eikenella glucosivorans]